MKKYINLVSIIFSFLTIGHGHTLLCYTKGLFIGSIQFPTTLESLPSVSIFCSGNKIAAEKNNVSKRITFTIPEDKRRTIFPVIITENAQWETEDTSYIADDNHLCVNNTVKWLKVPNKQKYKFYTLELVKIAKESEKKGRVSHLYEEVEYTYEWLIHEEKYLPTNGRIPDDSIVILYKPEYVHMLKGGSAFELPRIIIKQDVLKLAGSEEKLSDASISCAAASIDLNAIHANIVSEVTQENRRTVITLVT